MRRTVLAAATVAGVWLAAAPIGAHHSNAAMYDAEKRTVIKGEVTRIQWTNPHTYIYIEGRGMRCG